MKNESESFTLGNSPEGMTSRSMFRADCQKDIKYEFEISPIRTIVFMICQLFRNMKRAGLNETRVEGEAMIIEATAIIEVPIIVLVPRSEV